MAGRVNKTDTFKECVCACMYVRVCKNASTCVCTHTRAQACVGEWLLKEVKGKVSYSFQEKQQGISRDPKSTSISSLRNISRHIGCGLDLIRNLSGGV